MPAATRSAAYRPASPDSTPSFPDSKNRNSSSWARGRRSAKHRSALDIARQAAATGATIGVFSLEMSREQIVDRMISAASKFLYGIFLTGRIEDDTEFAMIQSGLEKLSSAKIFVDDSPSLNVIQMRSMARRLQVEHGLDLLIVDYLQLIRPRTSSDNVVAQVTEISRGLKALARELKVPVLALSQLSRGIEQRGGMPRLSDLRESGSIEQDADVVMFLYRKDRDPNSTYGETEEGRRRSSWRNTGTAPWAP